jgi:hypothetical protein
MYHAGNIQAKVTLDRLGPQVNRYPVAESISSVLE